MRDDVLSKEAFGTLIEAKGLVEIWRWEYNLIYEVLYDRIVYRPPALEVIISMSA